MTRTPLRRTATAIALGALLSAGPACASPAHEVTPAANPAPAGHVVPLTLPAPTGPHQLGTRELHLVDQTRPDPSGSADRRRELMVSLWYPAAPGAGGAAAPHLRPGVAAFYDELAARSLGSPRGTVDFAGTRTHAVTDAPVAADALGLPVLLYSPGGGQSRAMGTTLVEELASRGYVVVTIDHPASGPIAFPDRTEAPGPPADRAQMMRDRVRDVGFVIDHLAGIRAGTDAQRHGLPAGLATALDLSRIGMFGHSAGGFTAAEAMIADDRIDAGANLDGSMDPVYGEAARRGSSRPFLLMGGGTSGDDARPHNHLHSPDWAAFWQHSTGWKRDVHLPDAEHMSFTDQQVLLPQIDAALPLLDGAVATTIGTVDPERSLAAQRAYLTAFFDQHLEGRASALFDGGSPEHPNAQVVR
ncbi:alpha/beta hydrolase family protein [Pseudonocardia xinjiangensis]|uniref:Lipase n=1 Tax=Pseudonocardia xinjiangensis TaxID=75289 RepID=A0ABX1RK08_9PSEU|nr:lipase [Pseudonocardia xinjiangensis]NMH80702.1 lipase [Pseudonocardia xinjiangensis]